MWEWIISIVELWAKKMLIRNSGEKHWKFRESIIFSTRNWNQGLHTQQNSQSFIISQGLVKLLSCPDWTGSANLSVRSSQSSAVTDMCHHTCNTVTDKEQGQGIKREQTRNQAVIMYQNRIICPGLANVLVWDCLFYIENRDIPYSKFFTSLVLRHYWSVNRQVLS